MFSSILKRSFTTSFPSYAIQNVTVIGGGQMGSGIAQVSALATKNVTLVDQNDEILNRSKNGIATSLQRMGKKKFASDAAALSQMVSQTMTNISFKTDVLEASKNADLVIEAIVENCDAKKELFKKLDKIASPSTIFASNTSSFLIKSLSEMTNRQDKFGGLHFFNPVPVMKLLEIVTTPAMSDSTYEELKEFGTSVGKVCVKCKDTPGFIVNRLLIPYIMEAILMVERGDASMEDIDTAMKLGCGYPMGPIQLADFIGLDVFNLVAKGWARDYPEDPTFKTSKFLDSLVEKEEFGIKSGRGFYDYNK